MVARSLDVLSESFAVCYADLVSVAAQKVECRGARGSIGCGINAVGKCSSHGRFIKLEIKPRAISKLIK